MAQTTGNTTGRCLIGGSRATLLVLGESLQQMRVRCSGFLGTERSGSYDQAAWGLRQSAAGISMSLM